MSRAYLGNNNGILPEIIGETSPATDTGSTTFEELSTSPPEGSQLTSTPVDPTAQAVR